MIMSLNMGVTAFVARRTGEQDRYRANRCVKQSILLCIIISALLGALGYVFAEPLMRFAGAEADTLQPSADYFRVIMLGIIANALPLTINAAQRGAGNTKIAMRSNLVANAVNIVFNYLLITGKFGFPALGVTGAAIATVLGMVVATIMSVSSLLHKDRFLTVRNASEPWTFDRETLAGLYKISSSAFVEQVFMRIGFFTYAKIVASLGTAAFATHQICMQIMSLSFTFGDGLSVSSSSLVGQSLGERRPDMAIIYGKVGQRMAICVSFVLSILFLTMAPSIISLFTDDQDIIRDGIPLMYLTALITYFQISQVVYSGCLRGAGDVRFVALCSLISVTILRPTLTWVLCYPLNVLLPFAHLAVTGPWIAFTIDAFIRDGLLIHRINKGKWMQIKL